MSLSINKTERIFFHGLLIALLVLMTGMSAWGADLRVMIPAEALSFMVLKPHELWPTLPGRALMKWFVHNPKSEETFKKFADDTGIEIRDFKQIAIYVTTFADPKTGKHNMVFIFEAPFDVPMILAKAQKAGTRFSTTPFAGFPAVKDNGARPDSRLGSMIVFPDSSTMIYGEEIDVSAVLEAKSGKRANIDTNVGMAKLIQNVDTGAWLWGAGFLSRDLQDRIKNNPQFASMGAIDELFYSFDCRRDLSYRFTGNVGKPENVKPLTQALNGIVSMITMFSCNANSAIEGKILFAAFQRLKVESGENSVSLSLIIPQAVLEEMHRSIERVKSSPGISNTDLWIDLDGKISGTRPVQPASGTLPVPEK